MRVTAAVVASLALGCTACAARSGAPGDAADAKPDEAAIAARCAALVQDFEAALQQRGTCAIDQDCIELGGQSSPCDCAPALADCGGNPLEANAPGRGRAEADQAAWWRECAPHACTFGGFGECICDCAPAWELRCIDHRCAASTSGSCFPPGPLDAGVDASPDAAPDAP